MKPLYIESNNSNKVVINYRITEKCNYKCPYCYFKDRTPTNLDDELSGINNVFVNLEYVIDYYRQQKRKIHFF